MNPQFVEILRCPESSAAGRCNGKFIVKSDSELVCSQCQSAFQIVRNVPVFNRDQERAMYDYNYEFRTHASDLANNFYSEEREKLKEMVREYAIAGPSLDVGCGTAIFAECLPRFVGLDYSLQSLIGEGAETFDRACGTAEAIPFASQSFNCVFSFNALEHVPNVDKAFVEMDRVLAPRGIIILKPAWHCTRFQTELLPITTYRDLNLRQKFDKATMPLRTHRVWKGLSRLPSRLLRRASARWPTQLHFGPLTPNFSEWIADSDAAASIDCHEGILFFESRGYEPISHPKLSQKILAGHDWLVMRKPA